MRREEVCTFRERAMKAQIFEFDAELKGMQIAISQAKQNAEGSFRTTLVASEVTDTNVCRGFVVDLSNDQ